MFKMYKYRLYPTRQQVETLQWTLDRCRELYNAALQERKEAWKYERKFVGYAEQCHSIVEIKHEARTEYKQVAAHVLYNVLRRVDLAYQAFFRRVKNGETPGYPRYQGKNRYDSFTYPDIIGLGIHERTITLPKIGDCKVKLHRPIQGEVKTTTIKKEGGQWYVTLACEVEVCPRLPYTDEVIGIDLGVSKLATLSTGDMIEHPRYYRLAEQKLKKAQQSLSRKKRGSKRRRKAVQRVAKHHRKVRRQRQNFLHEQSKWLVDTYEVIVFEDLNTSGLTKAPKPKQDEGGKYLHNGASAKAGLNKSILDAGWGTFVVYCQYKAEYAGTVQVVFVNPHKTSQICSACGKEGPHKDLSERTHTCVHCSLVMDRDENAARNIKQRWITQHWLGRSLQN